MRRFGFIVVMLAAPLAGAQAAGDAARGRDVAAVCAPCHGFDGISADAGTPILAGQHAVYLAKSLRAYQAGQRSDVAMTDAVRTLTVEQIEDVAAWYATQRRLAAGPPSGSAPTQADARSAAQADDPASAPAPGVAAAGSVAAGGPPTREDERAGCPVDNPNLPPAQDFDRDGLPDRWDAAPADASEFVRDADGDGWYEICDIRQLQAIRTLGSGPGNASGLDWAARAARRYELARDLDAEPLAQFQPVGDCGPQGDCLLAGEEFGFTGSLEGHGHVIRRLRIARPEDDGIGLFGVLARAGSVRGVVLEKAEVTGRDDVGALVGANFGLVADCRAGVRVTGRHAVGALVGRHAGRLLGCTAGGEVTGTDAVGGLVGEVRGIVARASASTRVTGRDGVGGLAGRNTSGTVVSDGATGRVRGRDGVGGLVGIATAAVVGESYATAGVEAGGTGAGGLVGVNTRSQVRNSYARGEVRGVRSVGGLAGSNDGSIRASYATGAVRGKARLGGLVGDGAGGTLAASYWDLRGTGRVFGAGNDDAAAEGADNNHVDAGETNTLEAYGKTVQALRVLDGGSTGWLPGHAAGTGTLDPTAYYCDADADGVVTADEQRPDNVAWDFGNEAELPRLRCAGTDLAVQPAR